MKASAIDTAKRVLNAAWNGVLPIDPVRIAESIKVKNVDGEWCPIEVVGRSPLALSGASGQASLSRNKEGYAVFQCEFNSYENVLRSRFTIAHELGHILLGHVQYDHTPKRDDPSTAIDHEEISANSFAAELLMPEERVKRLFQGGATLSELANIFDVSEIAMQYRLKNLGLIL
ncbi:ImmA/IrrE family metallo-endopeptidase [Zymobacter palmae]|uniref:ImmA/IrrE family metallo-endopeptidase n=1 Tax=Zymobacter palmae TaxID=33074 RepID=UPI000482716D|nr:ImmA/IrrE family metallo-endopeptidase [Zymobacter palmae]